MLPPAGEVLRGSLAERYVTCGDRLCKCTRGERHSPVWYASVTLGPGRTTGGVVPAEQVEQVWRWIENYQQLKGGLEKTSEVNRELLRREQNILRGWKRKKEDRRQGIHPAGRAHTAGGRRITSSRHREKIFRVRRDLRRRKRQQK